jgi:hypothetical protein
MLPRRGSPVLVRRRELDYRSVASQSFSARVLRSRGRHRDKVRLVAAVRQFVPVNAVVRIQRALARRECVRRLEQERVQARLRRRPLGVPWVAPPGRVSDTYRVG